MEQSNDRKQSPAAPGPALEQLQALMDYIPDTIYFKDRASRFTRINRAQARVLGVDDPASAIGKTDFDFQRQDVSELSFAREQEIMASGQPLIDWIEYVPTPDGAPRWFSSTKVPIRDAAGQVTGLVGISRDVTEHQQTQAALEAQVQRRTLSLRMLSECNQALVRASDEPDLLDTLCRNIVAIGGYRLAWVGLAEHDPGQTVRPAGQAGDDDGFLQTLRLTWADTADPPSPSGLAIRTDAILVSHDVQNDPRFAVWHAPAHQRGYATAICLPLRRDEDVLGVLSLYSASPDAFRSKDEVDLLIELARDLSYGISTLRTRAALRTNEALLRETSRVARVGGWALDVPTMALFCSDETLHILEVEALPDVPSGINMYAPEARPAVAAAMEQALADGTPWDLEVPLITASGRRLWVRAQCQAELRDGRVVRLWGALQDITERRQAAAVIQQAAARAEALARLSKDLAEVSTQYVEALNAIVRLLAERIGDGCALYLVSDDGQWLVTGAMDHRDPGAAAALQALKAVSPGRADAGLGGHVLQTGQSLLIAQVDPAQLRAALPPEYDDYLKQYSICSLMCVALRAAGRPLGTLVMSRATPDQPYTADDLAFLEEVAGRAALVIANARLYADLEQRVQARTRELEAANRELQAFSYSVSHDLRAPLRAVDGFSQILLDEYAGQLDEQGRDFLRRVRDASLKMSGLIDALLALSRVTRADMRREPVDLSALARAAVAELRVHAAARAVEVVIADDLRAEGDARLLRAVLDNLLGNAWKFTGKTPAARIEFGRLDPAGDPGSESVFFVRDNGAGFDMAYADRLFGAFQRLHGEAEFPGSGIGLATVQRIVHRHGGRVWAEGQVGKGATIYFTLTE